MEGPCEQWTRKEGNTDDAGQCGADLPGVARIEIHEPVSSANSKYIHVTA